MGSTSRGNKMRYLLILLVTLSVFAKEKTYTEKEFQEKVDSEVMKKIDRLKKSSVTDLTKELVMKEKKIEESLQSIQRREEQLKLGEESLSTRIVEFEKEQMKVLNCIADSKAQSAQRVNQIVNIISGMKPAKAAQMLAIQDSQISVNILGKIDPVKASKIFNLMDKEVSARLQKQYLDMRK